MKLKDAILIALNLNLNDAAGMHSALNTLGVANSLQGGGSDLTVWVAGIGTIGAPNIDVLADLAVYSCQNNLRVR